MKAIALSGLVLVSLFGLSACGDSQDSTSNTSSNVEQKNTMEVKTTAQPSAPSLQQSIASTPEVAPQPAVTESAAVAAQVVEAPVTPAAPSGEQAYASCAGCHGFNGGGGVGPALKGTAADDLTTKLKAYRAGEQVGPMTVMMAPMAMGLTDEDIDVLVSYIVTF